MIDRAPPGFTLESWRKFAADGILVIEDALLPNHVERLAKKVLETGETYLANIVELAPLFAEMIAHPAHTGYVFDVYGDMLKLLSSHFFRRDPGQAIRNDWHFDGPRRVPFDVFSPELPLRIKVGFWLTPLPESGMGNLTFVRGSHRLRHLPQYKTHEAHPEQESLCVRAGAMTLMWGGLWHRVEENHSEVTRLNMFFEYGPSWVVSSDRFSADTESTNELTRAQRIIMRAYSQPNYLIKPPDADVPLFLPREGEEDVDSADYRDHVPESLRRRATWVERSGLCR